MSASIDITAEWDDRSQAWRLSVWEDGADEPTWLPGAARADTEHRLWPVIAAAATEMPGAKSDREGMWWDPAKTSKADMTAIAAAAQAAVAKVRT